MPILLERQGWFLYIQKLYSFNPLQIASRLVILEIKDLVMNSDEAYPGNTHLGCLPHLLSSSTDVNFQIGLNSVV